MGVRTANHTSMKIGDRTGNAGFEPLTASSLRRGRRFLTGTCLHTLTLPLCLVIFFIATHRTSFAAPGPSNGIPPLRPPHEEIPPGYWEQNGLWIFLLAIFIIAVGCAAVWFFSRPKPPAVVPPEAQARKALQAIRQQAEDGVVLSQVSQILRRYLAAAFDLPPNEMTTSEFCQAMAQHAQYGAELQREVSRFLRECDQHKFAPAATGPPLNAVSRALALVELAQARLAALREAAQAAGAKEAA